METQNDKKQIRNLVNEVRRYEIIADYFKKHPRRLTDRNKDYLEEILYRLYDIQEEQLPEQIKNVCTRILKNLSTKLDLI
jgi:transcription initiation factor IIE alpha subunit